MTGSVNYDEKALKILFWSPILRPLSPAPGDNCPLPPTLCHWATSTAETQVLDVREKYNTLYSMYWSGYKCSFEKDLDSRPIFQPRFYL